MFRIHSRGRPPHPGLFTPAEQRILPFLRDGLTNEYRFGFAPASGMFGLSRWIDGGSATLIVPGKSPAAHLGNATNHLELTCRGTVIEASVNGTMVASISDGAFAEGHAWIGMVQSSGAGGSVTPAGATIEARFSNLVVTQR